MSRRLVIAILVVLIIGIIGGTGALLWQQLGGSTTPGGQQLPPAGDVLENPNGDDDGDGLLNADEVLWGTDQQNPDSDGDGASDGDEVAAGRNPTIPGPNDALPSGFSPGQDLQPLTLTAPVTDQFFADNLNLAGDQRNLTQAYENRFAESERNPDSLAQFIDDQPVITQLPAVRDSAFTVQQNSGARTLAAYLTRVGHLAPLSNQSLLVAGLADLQGSNDPSGIRALQHEVVVYQETIKAELVPPEAVELHKLLLGYTELVNATLEQIASWPDDEVKATVALRQLDQNDQTYFPLLQQEVARLQAIAES